MFNLSFIGFTKVLVGFFLALSQSPVQTAGAHVAMLNLGDEVDGMILTDGASEALPLWAFCSSEVSHNITTANCRVPQVDKLAIGHVFLSQETIGISDWSELEWELYFDDKMINLEDFGTYRYAIPGLAPHPSPVRKVFKSFTAWDIVVTNLQPGNYTLAGRVHSESEEYLWHINLLIEGRTSPSPNPWVM